MKYKSALLLAVLLGSGIAAKAAYADPLTKQQLLKMKAAGIGEQVIAQQIQTNGIAFRADPDVTIALRKAGFSDAVLSALLNAQAGQVAAVPGQSGTTDRQAPPKGMMGITWEMIEPNTAARLGLVGSTGLHVAAVEPGGPAEKAGVKPDDVVLKLNNRPLGADGVELQRFLANSKPGEVAVLEVLREQATRQISITLAPAITGAVAPPEQRPPQAQVDPCVAWQQEWDRLTREDDAISDFCEQVAQRRNDPSYAGHCEVANCSIRKRRQSFPNPNSCPGGPEATVIYDCGDDSGYEPNPKVVYRPVQTLEPDDGALSCAQLKVLTSLFADNVAQMNRSISSLTAQAQTNSQMSQALSLIPSARAPAAPLAAASTQMNSSSQTSKAATIQEIRDSQQKRHDYLMQIYFQKQCDD